MHICQSPEPDKASLDKHRHTWAPTAISPDTTRNLSLSSALSLHCRYTVPLCHLLSVFLSSCPHLGPSTPSLIYGC